VINADEQTADEGVSARTAATLREAMNRLLAGRPQGTDGRLVKDNLWKEATVSRAWTYELTGRTRRPPRSPCSL
jgi:hypothetical protein